jgi:hypothetical protein
MENFRHLCKRGRVQEVKEKLFGKKQRTFHDYLSEKGNDTHFPFCDAIESGNVELARLLWDERSLPHHLDEEHLLLHVESLFSAPDVKMEMLDFLVEIYPDFTSFKRTRIQHPAAYYAFLAKYNRYELVRILIQRNEVERCRGTYNQYFRWYIPGIVSNDVFGQSTGHLSYSTEMCLLIYTELVERGHAFNFLDRFIKPRGEWISQETFLEALKTGKVPVLSKKRGKNTGKNLLHHTILNRQYQLATWVLETYPKCNHQVDNNIQSPLHLLLHDDMNELRKNKNKWKELDVEKRNLAKRMIQDGADTKGFPPCVQEYAASYKRIINTYWGVKARFPDELARMVLTYMEPLS